MDAANQIFIFLVCVLVGVASGVVYELFYILRKLCGDVAGNCFRRSLFSGVRRNERLCRRAVFLS